MYLPREDPTLKPAIYELVLYVFLHSNVQVGSANISSSFSLLADYAYNPLDDT